MNFLSKCLQTIDYVEMKKNTNLLRYSLKRMSLKLEMIDFLNQYNQS